MQHWPPTPQVRVRVGAKVRVRFMVSIRIRVVGLVTVKVAVSVRVRVSGRPRVRVWVCDWFGVRVRVRVCVRVSDIVTPVFTRPQKLWIQLDWNFVPDKSFILYNKCVFCGTIQVLMNFRDFIPVSPSLGT